MIENPIRPSSQARQLFTQRFDLSGAFVFSNCLYDRDNDLKITSIDLVYNVATSTHTQGETILVGIPSDTDKYCDITVATSTDAGTITPQTILSTAVLSAGTPLVIQKSAATGTSNTGEVSVVVGYVFNKIMANVSA